MIQIGGLSGRMVQVHRRLESVAVGTDTRSASPTDQPSKITKTARFVPLLRQPRDQLVKRANELKMVGDAPEHRRDDRVLWSPLHVYPEIPGFKY